MRKNDRLQKPLAILLVTMMLCMNLALQFNIRPVQADEGNLADKAVAFIKTQYQSEGAQNDPSTHYPYVAYVLKTAGLDLSGWIYNSLALTDANYALVDDDIANNTVPVKHLAQDLISMQAWENNDRVSQIQTLLHNRQQADGSFLNDSNVYSIIAAYELLGRAGQLSVVDTVYAQNYILGQQNTTSGAWPDFMTTAEAVRALNYLAPGSAADSTIGQAVSKGCDWLKQQQKSDGRFQAALDDPLIDTSEAIAVQKALGLNPVSAWINNGKSAVDYLNDGAVNQDGSLGSSKNLMDAAWALDSCNLLGILPTGNGGGGSNPDNVTVRVRVEGLNSNQADTSVTVSGTALDALQAAVGSSNITAPGGYITSINGESGQTGAAEDTDTAWFYYVIRNGVIDPASLSSAANGYNVANSDQLIFYIGAYGHTTYAPKTYFPVVSIFPQAPSAGQTVTLTISAQKYDWTEGVKDLSSDETSAIGNYIVTIGDATYTSSNGQVTISNVTAGAVNYIISNPNSAGYPNVVPWRGGLSITGGSGGGNTTASCTPGIAVVGMNGEILYGPSGVTVSASNTWGLTALGALDATGLSYDISTTTPGFVVSIAGQANSGSQGWMYTVNGTAPLVLAKEYTVSSSDKVIWYYSKSMSQPAPTWAQLGSGTTASQTASAVVTSTNGNAAINPTAGGTVGLGSEAVVQIPAGALVGTDAVNVVVQKLSSSPAAPTGFNLLGTVFEFSVGDSTAYKFIQPVTISFTFDPKDLSAGQTPSIYYYDERSLQWVNLGGSVSGTTISVKVDHFTKFAVLGKTTSPAAMPISTAPLTEKTFMDVPAFFWASDMIKDLSGRGYINGYPDGSFKPDNKISRAEFIVIINKMLKLPSFKPAQAEFEDVSSLDWYYESVEDAVNGGIVKGYGKQFLPDQEISREEMAVIIVNALDKKEQVQSIILEKSSFADDASISNWARGYVIVAARQGLIKGYPDQCFNPRGKASRAEACSMIVNFMNLNNTKS